MTTFVSEGLRLMRASERLGALMEPLGCVVRMTQDVRDLAPELTPELRELDTRLTEILEHVQAAMGVLSAKADLL